MNLRKRMLNDMDQDIGEHIARETQDNIDRGMSPDEARYAALRKFGNVGLVKENTREVWSVVWLEQLAKDIRFSLRMLRKNPSFTLVAVLTLALGIGANAAIFSLVRGVLLRPLVNRDENRLIYIQQSAEGLHVDNIDFSVPEIEDLRASVKSVSEFGEFSQVEFICSASAILASFALASSTVLISTWRPASRSRPSAGYARRRPQSRRRCRPHFIVSGPQFTKAIPPSSAKRCVLTVSRHAHGHHCGVLSRPFRIPPRLKSLQTSLPARIIFQQQWSQAAYIE